MTTKNDPTLGIPDCPIYYMNELMKSHHWSREIVDDLKKDGLKTVKIGRLEAVFKEDLFDALRQRANKQAESKNPEVRATDYLTPDEVAVKLNCADRTVRLYAKRGFLTRCKIQGDKRKIGYTMESVEAILRRNER